MKTHENAWTTYKTRREIVHWVLDLGRKKAETARALNTTPTRASRRRIRQSSRKDSPANSADTLPPSPTELSGGGTSRSR